jgi:hypothetical protein
MFISYSGNSGKTSLEWYKYTCAHTHYGSHYSVRSFHQQRNSTTQSLALRHCWIVTITAFESWHLAQVVLPLPHQNRHHPEAKQGASAGQGAAAGQYAALQPCLALLWGHQPLGQSKVPQPGQVVNHRIGRYRIQGWAQGAQGHEVA